VSEATISVILATRNRPASLRRCLESLGHCRLPPGWRAEVIVVDNQCDKAIESLVDALKADAPIEYRYFSEERPGKGFAVNRGTAAARGSILAFTDDDVVVDPAWLCEVIQGFDHDPLVALIAGRVIAADPRSEQPVAVTRGAEARCLNDSLTLQGHVLGCNLAIRRSVLQRVKGRDTRLGPGRGLSCEDIDFTYRVLRSGYRGIFLPGPTIYHEPGERDRRREYLRGWGAFYIKFLMSGDGKVARQTWWHLRSIGEEVARGKWSSGFSEAWHLTVGASIMAKRMALSRRPYG
jgi:GT2 family glycosyltransferase